MWHSYHGFIHNYNAIDDYLREHFDFVENLRDFFFIRYWQGGPHIRLRVKGSELFAEEVFNKFSESVENFINNNHYIYVQENDFYSIKFSELESLDDLYWVENGKVEKIAYHPEIQRYGGTEKLMALSEEIFIVSSKLACMLNKLSFNKRLVLALELMVITLKMVKSLSLGEGLLAYNAIWEPYNEVNYHFKENKLFDNILEVVLTGKVNRDVMKEYLNCLNNDDIIGNFNILFSHIHMTNNRLGITPIHEHALTSYIINYLRRNGKL